MRGRSFHNLLIAEVEVICLREGSDVGLEVPLRLPDGRTCFVDVLASRDGRSVALEIETTARTVLDNLSKTEALRLPLVIVVPNRRTQAAVRQKLAGRLSDRPDHQVWISLIHRLPQILQLYFSSFPTANEIEGKRKTNQQKSQSLDGDKS